MKNIIDICKDFGIEIPAEKHADFNKAVAENYKTSAEFEKKVNRLTDDLNAEKKRADTAEEALKGFEGIDPANVKTQLEEANRKVREAQEAAEKQISERDFNDALKTAMEGIKFSSAAAKRAFEADVRANCSKVKDGTIIGFSDVLASAKKEDASAFVDDNNPVARFDDSGNKGNPTGKLTMKEIMAIKDPVERQKQIGQNLSLFGRKGE